MSAGFTGCDRGTAGAGRVAALPRPVSTRLATVASGLVATGAAAGLATVASGLVATGAAAGLTGTASLGRTTATDAGAPVAPC